MEHPITSLDECVFHYLASKTDQIKSFTQIYNDITGTEGHRCPALNDPYNREKYKLLFINTCYLIEDKWDNVHKIFKNDKPFLVFSTRQKYDIIKDADLWTEYFRIARTGQNEINMDNVIDYVINDDEHSWELNNDLLEYLVRNNNCTKLTSLSMKYDLDITDDLIHTAVSNNKCDMLKLLLSLKHKNEILEHEIENNNLKKHNSKLVEKYNEAMNEMGILRIQLDSLNTRYVFSLMFTMGICALGIGVYYLEYIGFTGQS